MNFGRIQIPDFLQKLRITSYFEENIFNAFAANNI